MVTGSPGTGKSTLLALPVLLTDGPRRAELLRADEPGPLIQRTADLLPADTLVTAVHVRGLNTNQVAGAIARTLGRECGSASALLEDLDAAPAHGRRVVIVDAVDEAVSPTILLSSLLVPLAGQPGLQVAVGARRPSAVGDADLIIDLDSQEYTDPQALTDYIYRLLIAAEEPGVTTPYTPGTTTAQGDQSETAAAVAAAIATIAQFKTAREGTAESFLIGRLLALSVRGRAEPADTARGGWRSDLPANVAEAFDEDLARLGSKARMARTLLRALAWANGPGLPWENIWVPVARALAQQSDLTRHPPVTDEDVRWLLGHAGAYVVEDLGSEGRSAYRPFHDLLAEHLRGESNTEQDGHRPTATEGWEQRRARNEQAITGALLSTVPVDTQGRRNWTSAHPYLRTYLAQHAAAAGTGTLTALVQDADFLATADPVTLSPLLSSTIPELRDIARIYRRARPQLGTDPQANAAYLHEAARALTGTAAQRALARTASERSRTPPLRRTYLTPNQIVGSRERWLSAARATPTAGFYLAGETGRLRAAEDLAAWMTDPDPRGLAVVTGRPGTGKSALLAVPVLLTDEPIRAQLLRADDPGPLIQRIADLLPADTPVTAVHVRGLNTDEAADEIARTLGRECGSASALLEDLDAAPEHGRRVVIVDALDEAVSPTILLDNLLVPLAMQPGLRVLVGARRHVLSAVGDADLIIDLDSQEYTDPQALTDYIYRLLIAAEEPGVTTPYTPGTTTAQGDQSETAAAVAAAIAQEASGSFLVGKLAALTLRGRAEPADTARGGWRSDLPANVAEAFDEDLRPPRQQSADGPDPAAGAGLGQRPGTAVGEHLGPSCPGACPAKRPHAPSPCYR